MQVPTVAPEFLNLLQKSGLLTAKQVEIATRKLHIDESMKPEAIARRLVKKRVLTPFQAERLLEGRYRGFVIDRYRVREVLGVGGMGCVYIAEDTKEGKKVALKVMSRQHSLDAGMLARLKLEAEAGMQLQHPNVVETYGIDTTGALHYLVMEFIRAISLHELVALTGAVPWQMACDMFAQAARGLQEAHDHRIIHRDIKPANILVDKSGVTKILDFGLAKIEDNANEEFSLAMIFGHDCLGTPDYIAPEQATDSNNVDGRADIYSLGCTMYVALTARMPFPQKRNSAKIEAHRNTMPKPIAKIRDDVPPEVIAIVEKMIAKDPDDRFQTAAELAAALDVHAVRRAVTFDFRELVTLRAKQARDKEAAREKLEKNSIEGPRSSITSAAAWLQNSGHHLESGIDTLASEDTPAIRQPASGYRRDSRISRPAPPARGASRNRLNVPRGWGLRRLNSEQVIPITRVKTRIGQTSECEFRMFGSAVDDRQCTIEYDGDSWRFRQESTRKPTFVDGKAEAFLQARHGMKFTFSDGSGFELIDQNHPVGPQAAVKRGKWLVIAAVAIAVIIVAVVTLLSF